MYVADADISLLPGGDGGIEPVQRPLVVGQRKRDPEHLGSRRRDDRDRLVLEGAFRALGQFRCVIPIAHIESSAAVPAEDKLLFKSLKRPAIQAMRLDGSCKSEFSERRAAIRARHV